MELEDGAIDYTGEDLRDLKETGIARAVLLRDCWKEYHSTDDDVSFRQLCLMLQAYCLIYPIRGDMGRCIPQRSQSDLCNRSDRLYTHHLLHTYSIITSVILSHIICLHCIPFIIQRTDPSVTHG